MGRRPDPFWAVVKGIIMFFVGYLVMAMLGGVHGINFALAIFGGVGIGLMAFSASGGAQWWYAAKRDLDAWSARQRRGAATRPQVPTGLPDVAPPPPAPAADTTRWMPPTPQGLPPDMVPPDMVPPAPPPPDTTRWMPPGQRGD
jgi:hypothetical protein